MAERLFAEAAAAMSRLNAGCVVVMSMRIMPARAPARTPVSAK